MPDVETVDTEGIASEQIKIYIKIAGSYTRIPNVESLAPPGGTVEEVERKYLGTTKARYRPGTISEAGEITLTVNYDPNNTVHQLLVDRADNPGPIDDFKIPYEDGFEVPSNDTFSGFVTKFEPDDAEANKDQKADFTIRIDGGVTRTVGAAS